MRQGWRTIAEAADAVPASAAAGALVGAARRGLGAALAFADVLAGLPDAVEGYPGSAIGAQLALAGRLIRAGSGVRILHLPYGSFDTHDGQRGSHDQQMLELGEALAAFQRELDGAGHTGKVLVATTSEFGRRVPAELDGTDHGGASSMLLVGPVQPGRHGEDPSLVDLDEQDNLRATLHVGDYLATLVEGWLGVPAADVLPAGTRRRACSSPEPPRYRERRCRLAVHPGPGPQTCPTRSRQRWPGPPPTSGARLRRAARRLPARSRRAARSRPGRRALPPHRQRHGG
ncbi:MAG: DUF1501 domain-containing protein [Acidimicrobiales bacterium]